MFKMSDDRKHKNAFKGHKAKVDNRSRTWGKTKFKPPAFNRRTPAPLPVEENAMAWQHVKNDILDDEHEQRSLERYDMDSEEAKNIIKEREKNHRRNVIEAKRSEKTKWESFDDNETAASDTFKGPKSKLKIDPENLTFTERNFMRRKLTRAIMTKTSKDNLDSAITNMKRNHLVCPIKPSFTNTKKKLKDK